MPCKRNFPFPRKPRKCLSSSLYINFPFQNRLKEIYGWKYFKMEIKGIFATKRRSSMESVWNRFCWRPQYRLYINVNINDLCYAYSAATKNTEREWEYPRRILFHPWRLWATRASLPHCLQIINKTLQCTTELKQKNSRSLLGPLKCFPGSILPF